MTDRTVLAEAKGTLITFYRNVSSELSVAKLAGKSRANSPRF